MLVRQENRPMPGRDSSQIRVSNQLYDTKRDTILTWNSSTVWNQQEENRKMLPRKLNNVTRKINLVKQKNDAMRRICAYIKFGATCDEYASTPRGVSRLNWFSRNRPKLFWSALRQQQTVWRQQTSVVGRFVCLLRQDRPPSLSISSMTSVLFSLFFRREGRGKSKGDIR